MSDDGKLHFYAKTTSRLLEFVKYSYLTTLHINHKHIQLYHANKQKMCGTPRSLQWGKSANNVVSQEVKDGICAHINSLPRVESHYCRENTKNEYLSAGLNVSILYEEYVKQCTSTGVTPAKIHLYRQIFNNEFNIAFHMPKKDRCDTCKAMKIASNPTDEEKENYEKHLRGKEETKIE